jgi:hypothetical protein
MREGTRSGALGRYLDGSTPSWALAEDVARSHVDFTRPEWRALFRLGERPGCTKRQAVCFVLMEPVKAGGCGLSTREAGDLIGISHETAREHHGKASGILRAHPPSQLAEAVRDLARQRRPLPTLPATDLADLTDTPLHYTQRHGWPPEIYRFDRVEHMEFSRGGAIPAKYLTLALTSRRRGTYYVPMRQPEDFAGLVRADPDTLEAPTSQDLFALLSWKRRYWRAKYPPRSATASSRPLHPRCGVGLAETLLEIAS